MSKSRIYTKTGDNLTTSLLGGERVPKNSLRLETYGTIDELSSFIGFLISDNDVIDQNRRNLLKVQNILFNIGAILANPKATAETPVIGLSQENINEIEGWIDLIDNELPPLSNFILPGGTASAAKANMARTVCRRAERRLSEFNESTPVNPVISAYINRLSDYLFVIGRHLNKINDYEEITWQKPENNK